ncbi:MAG TPA: GAF domain-containing sensor histidine kinase [Rhodanobacteraceae bacterium]|nr:GAF domain-containing sensor histidine kinase [Rhodanobacteraceae bacterium]
MTTLSADDASIARDVAMVGRIEFMPTLLEVVSGITKMRFVAVAHLTDQRWTACAVHDEINFGVKPGSWLPADAMLCEEVRLHHATICFDHASADPHYSSHPMPRQYGFESYISIPIIRASGQVFGTLCALDPLPRKVNEANVLRTLQLFARLIASRMDLEEQIKQDQSALLDAKATAKLRDQFIAILGHDLRCPVQAIRMSGEVLRNRLPDGREHRMAEDILLSCDRIAELISNVLDFARGQLGGGIPVTLQPAPGLSARLQHVVKEIERAQPGHRIETTMAIQHEVVCDQERVAQLLSNLVSNAVRHGAEDRPVRISVRSGIGLFEIIVENFGKPIPPAMMRRLFQPFTRGEEPNSKAGLGLGLYIAAEIAKAHHGWLTASSDQEITRFAFRMPVQSGAQADTAGAP